MIMVISRNSMIIIVVLSRGKLKNFVRYISFLSLSIFNVWNVFFSRNFLVSIAIGIISIVVQIKGFFLNFSLEAIDVM